MQHLVIDHVFYQITRSRRRIEFAADHDGAVAGIVVAQDAAGGLMAPAETRRGNLILEEAAVNFVKNFFQVVVPSPWRQQALGAALATGAVNAGANRGTKGVGKIALVRFA